ncbi:hypothetical protein Scep_000282 [Stephania cephalantha]|uniref:Uncharacterized protein n=1 Tax=Stephania cephalantha TaxID=152367 RepID=A0AAP0L6B8_9MAGN
MIFVDYAGPLFPLVAHSPWNGVSLADFVMPYFLFIVGVSLALAYKSDGSTSGGYFHGTTSLTFGVDIESIRCLGILQVCTGSDNFQVLKDAPPWCHAPFDPEGILR